MRSGLNSRALGHRYGFPIVLDLSKMSTALQALNSLIQRFSGLDWSVLDTGERLHRAFETFQWATNPENSFQELPYPFPQVMPKPDFVDQGGAFRYIYNPPEAE